MFRYYYGSNEKSLRLIDSLEQKNSLARAGDSESVFYGRAMAKAVCDWSERDGEARAYRNKEMKNEPSTWMPTAPKYAKPAAPFWQDVRTMTSPPIQIVKAPDFSYSKDEQSNFFNSARRVYDVSKKLTAEQKEIAWFWDDSPNGKYLSVFGHWSSIFVQVASTRELSIFQQAEAFVKLAVSMHDASILCWKGKYDYQVVRPITFITQYIDKDWQPLIETPPHPEYPAAHASLSFAASTALTQVFGQVAFVDETYVSVGMPARRFSSFNEAAKEAGISRLYGGIHYEPSIDAGAELGVGVARHVIGKLRLRNDAQVKN